MKTKTLNILYWTLTILFSLLLLMDGIGGITKQQAGQDVLRHLGYPIYLMVITGAAKIAAAFALIQTKYKTLKEWAFAGITFNFLGAFFSRVYMGDSLWETAFPLIFLAIMVITYILWKKYEYKQKVTLI